MAPPDAQQVADMTGENGASFSAKSHPANSAEITRSGKRAKKGPGFRATAPAPPVDMRWKPGVSGNPSGRPGTLAAMRRALEEAGGESIYRESLIALASGGDDVPPSVQLGAVIELGNRLYGRPEQQVNLTGDENSPALAQLGAATLARLMAALAEPTAPPALPDVTVAGK